MLTMWLRQDLVTILVIQLSIIAPVLHGPQCIKTCCPTRKSCVLACTGTVAAGTELPAEVDEAVLRGLLPTVCVCLWCPPGSCQRYVLLRCVLLLRHVF